MMKQMMGVDSERNLTRKLRGRKEYPKSVLTSRTRMLINYDDVESALMRLKRD
jgi:hypothetical protein